MRVLSFADIQKIPNQKADISKVPISPICFNYFANSALKLARFDKNINDVSFSSFEKVDFTHYSEYFNREFIRLTFHL